MWRRESLRRVGDGFVTAEPIQRAARRLTAAAAPSVAPRTGRSPGSPSRRSPRSSPSRSSCSPTRPSSAISAPPSWPRSASPGSWSQTAVGLFVFLAYGTTSTVARSLGAGDRRTRSRRRRRRALARGRDRRRSPGWRASCSRPERRGRVLDATPAGAVFAVTYLRIASFGIPALLLMLAATGVLRGLQDTRTPLVVAVAANLANIVLNLTFVYGFGWGIAGSAIGTLLAQGLAALRSRGRRVAHRSPDTAPGCGRVVRGIRGAVRVGRAAAGPHADACGWRCCVTTYVAAAISTPALAAHQVAFTALDVPCLRPGRHRDRRPGASPVGCSAPATPRPCAPPPGG